jgi:hypothetical protein
MHEHVWFTDDEVPQQVACSLGRATATIWVMMDVHPDTGEEYGLSVCVSPADDALSDDRKKTMDRAMDEYAYPVKWIKP